METVEFRLGIRRFSITPYLDYKHPELRIRSCRVCSGREQGRFKRGGRESAGEHRGARVSKKEQEGARREQEGA